MPLLSHCAKDTSISINHHLLMFSLGTCLRSPPCLSCRSFQALLWKGVALYCLPMLQDTANRLNLSDSSCRGKATITLSDSLDCVQQGPGGHHLPCKWRNIPRQSRERVWRIKHLGFNQRGQERGRIRLVGAVCWCVLEFDLLGYNLYL